MNSLQRLSHTISGFIAGMLLCVVAIGMEQTRSIIAMCVVTAAVITQFVVLWKIHQQEQRT